MTLNFGIEYLVYEMRGLRPARPSQFATALKTAKLGLYLYGFHRK